MPIVVRCKSPMCPVLIEEGQGRYCLKHAPEKKKEFKQRMRKYSSERDPFLESKEWRRIRKVVIAEEPVCFKCHRKPSVDAHHVKPRQEYPELKLERSNLRGICKSCHWVETQREQRLRRQQNRQA